MSGGQQQRVALARALVNHPKVLLLDEPLGALDLKLRKQMQLELKRIQQEVGITFIYVTHDQEEAMTMSNRLAVMRHGKIEQLGAPEVVYENPATEFVAGFLGASNMLDGELEAGSNGVATVSLRGGGVVRLPHEPRAFRRARHREGRRAAGEDHDRREGRTPAVPEGVNSVSGCVTMTTYIGVSHQYKVEGSGRHDHDRLRAEPGPRGRSPAAGEAGHGLPGGPSTRSRSCPQEGLIMEEDEA